MSSSAASYPSSSHQSVNLPPLGLEHFTKHQDFGKPQLSSHWLGPQYPPSPPMTHSPASPRSSAATSFAGSAYNSAGGSGFERTPSASFNDSTSTSFAANFSSSRNLPQPDSLARHTQSSGVSAAPSSAYFSSSASSRAHQLSRNNSDDGSKGSAMENSNGKVPARKAKPHVQQACANCKKAHLACDVSRPCARCVTNGKTDTCRDVEHKKRGRPRLRDDRGQKIPQPNRHPAGSTPLTLNSAAVRQHNHRYLAPAYPEMVDRYGRRYTVDMTPADHKYMSAPAPLHGCNVQSDAMALLDLDFKISQCNEHFRTFFPHMRIEGVRIEEMVDTVSHGTLKYFKNLILGEKQRREQSIIPGLGNTQNEIPDIRYTDYNTACAHFTAHEHPFNFRSWNGSVQELVVTFRLAQVPLSYFVVVSVRSNLDDMKTSSSSSFYSQPSNSFSQSQLLYQQPNMTYSSGTYSLAPGPAPQSLDSYNPVSSMTNPQSPSYYDVQPSSFNASPLNVRTDQQQGYGNYLSQSNSSTVPRSSQAMYYNSSYGNSGPASAPATDGRYAFFGSDMLSGQSTSQQPSQQTNYGMQPTDARQSISSQQINSLPPLSNSADDEQRRKRRQLEIGGLVE